MAVESDGFVGASTSDDVLQHREFLADGGSDTRRRFAETLIEARDPKGAAENWDHVLAFLAALPKPPG